MHQQKFISATGGTITTCGNFKTHTFTGPGTFVTKLLVMQQDQFSRLFNSSCWWWFIWKIHWWRWWRSRGYETYLQLLIVHSRSFKCPAKLPVSAQGYPITVGGGGAGIPNPSNSRFS